MALLTEYLILSKARADHLEEVKSLNLWGNELSDITLLRKIPNVEVLSLSVNHISTLEDFSHCPKLVELYLRKNNVRDINEVLHLRDLENLKVLWLSDNPLAEATDYRPTVIRTLPRLKKLDNRAVTEEERTSAQLEGRDLASGSLQNDNIGNSSSRTPGETDFVQQSQRPAWEKDNIEDLKGTIRAAAFNDAQNSSAVINGQVPSAVDASTVKQVDVVHIGVASGATTASPAPTPLKYKNAQSLAGSIQPSLSPSAKSRNSNILYAVLSLLNELDHRSLLIVADDVQHKLTSRP
eukprot:Clim_evm258s157 gene=Clim_evmTU258s157